MQSAETTSPQKQSNITSQENARHSVGPYRTIATNYTPFSAHHKLTVSKIEDSPIKIINQTKSNPHSKSAKFINRQQSLSYQRPTSSDKKILVNLDEERQYVGEYNGKVKEGQGKLYNGKGTLIYEGQWFNDQPHGSGIWYNNEIKLSKDQDTQSHVSKYIGQFKQGYKCGAGIEYYRDGSVYVGNFDKDCRNGLGQLTLRNGQKQHGTWFKGKLIDKI